MRKTKIICTLGPATDSDDVIRQLMLSGMNVARFNFSHGDHEGHKKRFDQVVKYRNELNLPIATLLDTRGPEIRIKTFKDNKVELTKGHTFTLTTREVEGDDTIVTVNYPDLPYDIENGSSILIDDGLIELRVKEISGGDIICEILNSGVISNNKGVNVPNTKLSMPYVSQKDKDDIIFGVKTGFDFIAASFTRTADDILQIKRILKDNGGVHLNIIAKIENKEGVENIDDILRVADGVMVARGDMGVEIPLEEVPLYQKMIIKKAYASGKQVITATQMLDSMMKNPRPTRAEANDVANAIYDGTSAIMLSGETAAGLYPIESLKTMVRIAEKAEGDIDYAKRFRSLDITHLTYISDAISHATCSTAQDLDAGAIITISSSGRTARMISRYRPSSPIISCTTSTHTCRQLNMSWGVFPVMMEEKKSTDELFDDSVTVAESTGIVSKGDLVVITAGVPLGVSGTTNMMKVHVVGDILATGKGVNNLSVTANVCVAHTEEEALNNFNDGDILVITQTTNALMPILQKARGIITERQGEQTHAEVAGLALNIPVIIGCESATQLLKSGSVITMDAAKGMISAACH